MKLAFVTVFLAAAGLTFVLSGPLAAWIRAQSEPIGSLTIQAVIALPFMLLVFVMEEKLIWKLVRQDVFSTIHPISIGAYVGYLIHFALG